MRLDLSHIRQPETSVLRQFEPSAFADQDEDYRVIAPATLAFTVDKDNDRFRLAGTLTTTLELRCSRCLEAFTLPVNAAFDLRYLPEGMAAPDADTEDGELADEDTAATYYRGDEIDLGDLMREQFYLALPMKPLCRPDCKGLCPQCGINLNTDTCQCEMQWEDPRLAGLKALIPDRKTDNA
jgi:uncharacterized protein